MDKKQDKDPSFVDLITDLLENAITPDEMQHFADTYPEVFNNLSITTEHISHQSRPIKINFTWKCSVCRFVTERTTIIEHLLAVKDTHLKYFHPAEATAESDKKFDRIHPNEKNARALSKQLDGLGSMVIRMFNQNSMMTEAHVVEFMTVIRNLRHLIIVEDDV